MAGAVRALTFPYVYRRVRRARPTLCRHWLKVLKRERPDLAPRQPPLPPPSRPTGAGSRVIPKQPQRQGMPSPIQGGGVAFVTAALL